MEEESESSGDSGHDMNAYLERFQNIMMSINVQLETINNRLDDHSRVIAGLQEKRSRSGTPPVPTIGSPPDTPIPTTQVKKAPATEKDFAIKGLHHVSTAANLSEQLDALKVTPKKDVSKSGKSEAQVPMTLSMTLKMKGPKGLLDPQTPVNDYAKSRMIILDNYAEHSTKRKDNAKNVLKHNVPFTKKKLSQKGLKMIHVLEMMEAMTAHATDHGERLTLLQVIDEDLQSDIAALYLNDTRLACSHLSEERLFECLVVQASSLTVDEFIKDWALLKPKQSFVDVSFNFYNFRDLYVQMLSHVHRVEEFHKLMTMNNKAMVPKTFKINSDNSSVDSRKSLVQLFLDSMPHEIGKIFYNHFDIQRKGTFDQFLQDWKDKLIEAKGQADTGRALYRVLVDCNDKKKGSVKHQIAKSDKLYNVEPMNANNDSDDEVAALEKPISIAKGCYKAILDPNGKCPDGAKCPHSHNPKDLSIAHAVLLEQCQKKLKLLKNSQYASKDAMGTAGKDTSDRFKFNAGHYNNKPSVHAINSSPMDAKSEKRKSSMDLDTRCEQAVDTLDGSDESDNEELSEHIC